MDMLPVICGLVAGYMLILILIIAENRKHPPSIERIKGNSGNAESYIVSVIRFNRGWGMSYSEFCFHKGKDGKYRLKTSVIAMIFRVVALGFCLLLWIEVIKIQWNSILRHPGLFIPSYLILFFLNLGLFIVPESPRIIARIYFYKYMKKHGKNKRIGL